MLQEPNRAIRLRPFTLHLVLAEASCPIKLWAMRILALILGACLGNAISDAIHRPGPSVFPPVPIIPSDRHRSKRYSPDYDEPVREVNSYRLAARTAYRTTNSTPAGRLMAEHARVWLQELLVNEERAERRRQSY